MFDNFLIRKDSLKNVYPKGHPVIHALTGGSAAEQQNKVYDNGKAVGFKFAVRIADYRGCFLSLHNGYYIDCDGTEYPRELQKFEINGKEPRDFETIRTCVWEHWNYDDEGWVYVQKAGGLSPGKHVIRLQQSVLAAYGYMPWDEECLLNPPVPGKGAGAGKTDNICEFELFLRDEEAEKPERIG